MEYIEKFYTLDISMHTKPSDILEKTQLISWNKNYKFIYSIIYNILKNSITT